MNQLPLESVCVRGVVVGVPRTKKTHSQIVTLKLKRPRMTKAGKLKNEFHKLLPSASFLEWNKSAQLQLIELRRLVPPGGIAVPVNCAALFYRDADRGDLVGFFQSLADALQEAGIVRNDVLVKSWDGSRALIDRVNPRVEFTLTDYHE